MACSAVTITGRSQIVERRRSYAQGGPGIGSRCATRQIGVALQAHETNFLSHQHPWVRRAVWFVAAAAALESHRCMFERERAALVGVASEAARFIRCERLRHGRAETTMRIVA